MDDIDKLELEKERAITQIESGKNPEQLTGIVNRAIKHSQQPLDQTKFCKPEDVLAIRKSSTLMDIAQVVLEAKGRYINNVAKSSAHASDLLARQVLPSDSLVQVCESFEMFEPVSKVAKNVLGLDDSGGNVQVNVNLLSMPDQVIEVS
jgi:hypothetical protein